MDIKTWLDIRATHNPNRWVLPVAPEVCSGLGTLFGGCGIGAAIVAMEGTAQRPVVWATAQYLGFAPMDTMLDIDVELVVEGRSTTQARATGHLGGREIITVNAALGTRDFPPEAQFSTMPDVVPAAESAARELSYSKGKMRFRMEQRWAQLRDQSQAPKDGRVPGLIGEGRMGMWVKVNDVDQPAAATLGVVGDFVPMAIRLVMNQPISSNSLDNTLRVLRVEPTEWYLLDVQVQGLASGVGHGSVHIYSEAGTLLAIGSQSAICRPGKD